MNKTYLTEKFREVYQDISPRSREHCKSLINTYLGRYSHGSLTGLKLRTLDELVERKTKGDAIIEQDYHNPDVSVESKTAMDILRSTFIEYTHSIEAQVDEWRNMHIPEATKGIYELSMAYQGRAFNGEKSPSLETIGARYRRADQIIRKLLTRGLTEEKAKAIKDLARRFMNHEQATASQEKYKDALRAKHNELMYTVDRFAEHYSRKNPKKKQQKQQTPTGEKNILDITVSEAAGKAWEVTKKIALLQIF